MHTHTHIYIYNNNNNNGTRTIFPIPLLPPVTSTTFPLTLNKLVTSKLDMTPYSVFRIPYFSLHNKTITVRQKARRQQAADSDRDCVRGK